MWIVYEKEGSLSNINPPNLGTMHFSKVGDSRVTSNDAQGL